MVFSHHIRASEALRPRLTVAGFVCEDLLGRVIGHLVEVVVPQHPRITEADTLQEIHISALLKCFA